MPWFRNVQEGWYLHLMEMHVESVSMYIISEIKQKTLEIENVLKPKAWFPSQNKTRCN